MGILYTSKLPRKAYPIDREAVDDMTAQKAAFCVNCCEQCAPVESQGEYCEACDCESIFSVDYLVDRQWFVILEDAPDDKK